MWCHLLAVILSVTCSVCSVDVHMMSPVGSNLVGDVCVCPIGIHDWKLVSQSDGPLCLNCIVLPNGSGKTK